MNNKGFTLVELIATLVVLSIVLGFVLVTSVDGFQEAKDNTENVFVDTIKDAMEVYLSSSSAKSLNFDPVIDKCNNILNKKLGNVNVYETTITMADVISSEYHPISQSDLKNPANGVECANGSDILINIYKDDDYVYYYSIDKAEFDHPANGVCFVFNGEVVDSEGNTIIYPTVISNLPEGYSCS